MKRVVSLLCIFVMLSGYLQASVAVADDYHLLVSTLYKKQMCQCAVKQLEPFVRTATTQDLPTIQKILSELEYKQQLFAEQNSQERHDWTTLFNETLHAYSHTASVTRGDRPDEAETTGTSSPLPAIDPAIASAVQLVIECINNQGSWSVERLLVRDKAVINHLTVSHTIDVTSLHVTGDLIVDGNTTLHDSLIEGDLCVSGNIAATGTISAAQSACPSDKRIKTNVHTLDQQKSFDVIKRLRPISYTYTPEFVKQAHVKNNNIQLGLIAQEVEELVPEVVSPLSIGGQEIRGISYDRLVPYLIGSIQALANELKELKKQRY